MYTLNPNDLREAIVQDFRCKNIPLVRSSPGMGKSDIIRSVAKQFNMKVIDKRLSQCEPTDLQGFPESVNGRMRFSTPEDLPLSTDPLPMTPAHTWADQDTPEYYNGWILFLDEFTSAEKDVEKAAYKLLLDRMVYLYDLHPQCLMVAAGNLSSDRAIVNSLSTATMSRVSHYQLEVDDKLWIEWANAHDIDHRIISFIKFRPEMLHKFDPATSEETFPCPRTWEFVSRAIKDVLSLDGHVAKARVAANIGEGAQAEFTGYCNIYQSLPKLEDILKDPKKGWKVPSEPSEQYAITTLLAHNVTKDNVDNMVTAIERLPIEFQVITFRDIYKKTPHLKEHPRILKWISENASEMF